MMVLKDKLAQIRKDLKAKGITSKMVAVRGKYSLYDESITIKIKDVSVSKKLVESIVNKYEEISYDQYNGEILAGGNTYIHIEFDWNALEEAKEQFIDLATEIFNKGKEECEKPYELYRAIENDSKVVLYQPNYSNGNAPSISLKNIITLTDEYGSFKSYDNVKSYIATCPENIASFLVECKYQYGLSI